MRGRVLSILSLVLVGCGSQTASVPKPMNLNSEGIVNGTDVTTPDLYSQHTVFLQMQLSKSGAICTGSILDSQTILTAAHCVSGASSALIVFAPNVQNAKALTAAQVRQADIVAVYPKYQPTPEPEQPTPDHQAQSHTQTVPATPVMPTVPTLDEVEKGLAANDDVDFDVAMLHFQGGLPAGYSPVQLATSPSIVQPGAVLHMLGYGLSKVNPEVRTVNGKNVTVPVPDQTTPGQLRETEVAVAQYNADIRMIITDAHQTGVCSGDSGGPAFIQTVNGDVLQVGIAEAVSSPYCNSASMHTAIFPYLNWIKGMAAAMAKQAHPKPAQVASLK